MGWVDALKGQTVGLDTAPLIYYIEDNPTYLPVVEPFFEAMDQGEIVVVTSTVTLLEVLVQPLRRNETDLVARYRAILLNAEGLVTMDLLPDIAEKAADLRANFDIRTPDAIQIATALFAGSTALLTNDRRLSKVSEVNTLLLDDLL